MSSLNNKGLTLVESLISLLLLSFILVSGIDVYFYADEIMVLAAHKKMAVELANAALEDLKKQGYDSLPQPGPPAAEGIHVGSLSAQKKVYVDDIDEDPADGTTDYKQVRTEIIWQETQNNTPRRIEMTTYIGP